MNNNPSTPSGKPSETRRSIRDTNGAYRDHVQRVMIVRDRHPDGTPRTVEIMRDHDEVDVTRPENREFMTGWIDVRNFEK